MAEKIVSVMTRDVETVAPDATVQEAARKMKDRDVGPLPVCEGERLIGILTDRDIAVRAVAAGKDPGRTPVREIMTAEIVCCTEDDDIDAIAAKMKEREVRRIPVVDADRRVTGIVALADLAVYARSPEVAGDVLEKVSRPAE